MFVKLCQEKTEQTSNYTYTNPCISIHIEPDYKYKTGVDAFWERHELKLNELNLFMNIIYFRFDELMNLLEPYLDG
jgi:hypothetical protein